MARESVRVSVDFAPVERVFAVATLVEALAHQDKGKEALELAATIDIGQLQPTPHTMAYLGCRARAAASQRDFAAQLADLCEAETALLSSNMSDGERMPLPDVLPWQVDHVFALLAQGRAEDAASLAEDLHERARSCSGRRVAIGLTQRALAATRGGAEQVDLLHAAVDNLGQTPAQLELGWATCELGAALRRQRKRKVARDYLTAAARLAQQLGAVSLFNTASAELAASGQRLRARNPSFASELTPAERRVATLAIEGMTNREIAQALFLTTKTVETHLSHIFQKLDITSRRQLSAALKPTELDATVVTTA
jgi:DNA-binding CsgD family transcriptional regulator